MHTLTLSGKCLLLLCCVSLATSVFAQHPYKYSVEFRSGKVVQGVWMHFDSVHDVNEFVADTTDTATTYLNYREVKQILTIADPIRPPHELPWGYDPYKDTGKPPIGSPVNTNNEIVACDCNGYDRTTSTYFLDTRIGLNGKGKNSYTYQTATGPETVNSKFFSPSNIGSTNLTYEGEVAAGWIVGQFDVGAMVSFTHTDGALYFPVGLHGRYYFDEEVCCSWNIFGDIGLPLDFATGTPVFISPVTSRRQRKFFDIGIGKQWPWSASMRLAVDAGYRYMVLPLNELECCPTVPGSDRFPSRESNGFFIQVGFTF